MATAFDMKSKSEKKQKIHEMDGDFLYHAFRFRESIYDPMDEKMRETFALMEDEILRRLTTYDSIQLAFKKPV